LELGINKSTGQAISLHAAAGRIKCTADHLQQSRFTAAVSPDGNNGFAFVDLERNVFKRPEFTKILLARSIGSDSIDLKNKEASLFIQRHLDAAILIQQKAAQLPL
jgi:hypothetical protein